MTLTNDTKDDFEYPRAMLYSFTQMSIAFYSHTLNNSNFRHYFFGEPMNAILCNGNYSRF